MDTWRCTLFSHTQSTISLSVCLQVDLSECEDTYTLKSVIPAPLARYGEQTRCYVCLSVAPSEEEPSLHLPVAATLPCELQFKMVSVDPVTGVTSYYLCFHSYIHT